MLKKILPQSDEQDLNSGDNKKEEIEQKETKKSKNQKKKEIKKESVKKYLNLFFQKLKSLTSKKKK